MMTKNILDVCCGSRMFWFDKSDERVEEYELKDSSVVGGLRDLKISPDIQTDFTFLPFASNQFQMVVFDPPHFAASLPSRGAWIETTCLIIFYAVPRSLPSRGAWIETTPNAKLISDNGKIVHMRYYGALWDEIHRPMAAFHFQRDYTGPMYTSFYEGAK